MLWIIFRTRKTPAACLRDLLWLARRRSPACMEALGAATARSSCALLQMSFQGKWLVLRAFRLRLASRVVEDTQC